MRGIGMSVFAHFWGVCGHTVTPWQSVHTGAAAPGPGGMFHTCTRLRWHRGWHHNEMIEWARWHRDMRAVARWQDYDDADIPDIGWEE